MILVHRWRRLWQMDVIQCNSPNSSHVIHTLHKFDSHHIWLYIIVHYWAFLDDSFFHASFLAFFFSLVLSYAGTCSQGLGARHQSEWTSKVRSLPKNRYAIPQDALHCWKNFSRCRYDLCKRWSISLKGIMTSLSMGTDSRLDSWFSEGSFTCNLYLSDFVWVEVISFMSDADCVNKACIWRNHRTGWVARVIVQSDQALGNWEHRRPGKYVISNTVGGWKISHVGKEFSKMTLLPGCPRWASERWNKEVGSVV